MSLWKGTAVLAVVLAGLVLWDRSLSLREESRRLGSSRVRQLVPKESREGKLVSAIRLEVPGRNETFLYARSKETWRCLSRFGAPADEGKIRSLLDKLFSSQGIVQTRNPVGYGFGSDSVLRISFHGPRAFQEKGGDLLFAFDVGLAIPGGEGCYVRKSESAEVVALTANLREELEPPEGKGLPPLIDPHIIPPAFAPKGGPRQIDVERVDGEKYELLRRERKVSPEELKAGRPPWDWALKKGEREEDLPPGPVNAYAAFLLRAPFAAVLDPKTKPQLGLEKPAARLVLHGSEGDPVEIAIGKKGASGGAPVENALTRCLLEVAGEVADLLAPRWEALAGADPTNPWDAWLRR